MPRRTKPARLRKQKQKKAALSSSVITPDDIITCMALVGGWTISATCKRSESEECMKELKDLPCCIKECTVSRDFDPTPEQENLVLINAGILHEAESLIESCEHCNPLGAEISFDAILDRVTGSDPGVTDYVLEQPAKCPNCCREILEKTLIELA